MMGLEVMRRSSPQVLTGDFGLVLEPVSYFACYVSSDTFGMSSGHAAAYTRSDDTGVHLKRNKMLAVSTVTVAMTFDY
jgi:hypothetical protein